MNSASADQRRLVGLSCSEYSAESLVSSAGENMGRSCDTCRHWDGNECNINVFDKVLTGLDQT